MANWNDLLFEMKEIVVKEMTLETRARLKMCSKADKYLVESIPWIYDKIYFKTLPSSELFSARLTITRNLKKFLDILIEVDMSPGVSVVKHEHDLPPRHTNIQCANVQDGEKVVQQAIRSVISTGRLRFKEVDLDFMYYPIFPNPSELTIHTEDVRISGSAASQVTGWLKSMAPGVKEVFIHSVYYDIEGLGTIPAIMNASKLKIKFCTDINDEQLLNFKCTYMKHSYRSNITGKGLNQLIKKVIANDYPIGSSFQINVNVISFSQTWNEIIEGLDVEIVELVEIDDDDDDDDDWDAAFDNNIDRDVVWDEDEQMEIHGAEKGRIQMSHGKRLEVSLCDSEFSMSIKSS